MSKLSSLIFAVVGGALIWMGLQETGPASPLLRLSGLVALLLAAVPFLKRIVSAPGFQTSSFGRQVLWIIYFAPLWGACTVGVLLFRPDAPIVGAAFLSLVPAGIILAVGRYPLAVALRPVRQVFRSIQFGKGGSARFGSLLDEWETPYRKGSIFLGASLYSDAWRIGHKDDRHFLTIASNRSGKGRSAIIPNLLKWPGAALVIDPKGTNATVTTNARLNVGNVHILDPFKVVQGEAVKHRAHFNPLATINVNSSTLVEDIGLVVDALVVPEPGGDFWDDGARAILKGVIAHLLLEKGENATLSDMRELVITPAEYLVPQLVDNAGGDDDLSRLVRATVSQLSTGTNEAGSHLSVAKRNTHWLDSRAMQETLSHCDFSLTELKRISPTLFLVLPPHLLEEHSRFLRLFVNLSIRAMSASGKREHPVLFLLDEFYSLGRMNQLAKASGLLAGYGVKLWPIVQNLTQLVELYGENWETFFSNAGAVQVFAINDKTTAEYLAYRLGVHETERLAPGVLGEQGMVERTMQQLRQAEELGRETSRQAGQQIVIRSGTDPLLLRRINYDQDRMFKSLADPDPDFHAYPEEEPEAA